MELKSEMQATCIKESHFIQGQGKYQDEGTLKWFNGILKWFEFYFQMLNSDILKERISHLSFRTSKK